jgi:hypothetical protein
MTCSSSAIYILDSLPSNSRTSEADVVKKWLKHMAWKVSGTSCGEIGQVLAKVKYLIRMFTSPFNYSFSLTGSEADQRVGLWNIRYPLHTGLP